MVDLHLHSQFSDGTDTIEEIIAKAKALGLTQIAITDHNTLKGALYAQSLPHEGIEIICGVELSCDHHHQELHILGYFPKHQKDFTALEKLISLNEAHKEKSQREMIARLQQHGAKFTYEDMKNTFTGVILNRVHIAKMMVKTGFVQDVEEAFDQYIDRKKDCYVKTKRCNAYEAIEAIHACNGLAYLAHPFDYHEPFEVLDELVNALDGVEVKHSSFNDEQSKQLLDYAEAHSLRTSGGSDYHGVNKKTVFMGEPAVEICHSIVF